MNHSRKNHISPQKSLRVLVILFSVFLLLSSACSNKVEDPLRVGMLLWPPYEFFYLAKDLGYYENQNIELVSYRTPSEVIRAYETGLIDALIVTDHLFLKMNDEIPADRILMIINYSSGSDRFLAQPHIRSITELKGKRIGAEASALGIYVMLRFLELNGLTANDIIHVPIDVALQPQAFQQDKFDGVVTYEPFATQMINVGAVELSNSRAMPLEISDVLVASTTTIVQKKEQLTSLCKGFFMALDDFRNDPDKFLPILAEREELTPSEFLDALNGITVLNLNENMLLLSTPDTGFFKTLLTVNNKMREFGLVNNTFEPQEMIDLTILETIENEAQ